jgi:hypothetical protein
MFKEILQIIPRLAQGDLNNMERSLSKRFGNVAKKFGKGLLGALTGGGVAGIALGLIDKLLNPLKETQDAIDKVLKQGDDVVTNAKQFGTTAGKLFRLQALGKSTGLDAGSLNMLLEKFQTSVAEAKADPNKQTSVRNFVNEKDTAEAFFQFIQSLQKMDKNQQVLVQQEVFGEKQILKMADFLQSDFFKQSKALGGPSAGELTPRLEKLAGLNDLKDTLEARRELNDTFRKGGIINEGMIRSQDEQAKQELARENSQIKSYQDLAAISIASTEIMNTAKSMVLQLTSLIVRLTDLTENVKKITGSATMRGIIKWMGGK